MEQASQALNTEKHFCCFHGDEEVQGAPELQSGGLIPEMRLLQKDGDGLSQKMNQNGDAILQAVGLMRRRHGIPAKTGKLKTKRVYVNVKTRWSAEETEALLKAIESCNLSNNWWSSKANKWERVLQHMQAHGFSEKNTFTVQKKYQNIHWAFRNLKAWRIRNKRPLFENLTPSERLARLLPRSFCPNLYARMETFFASTGLNDGVSMVRDQDRVSSIRNIRKSLCGANDEEDDKDDNDDDDPNDDNDDDDPNYHIGGSSLPSIKSHRKHINSLALCLHGAAESNKGEEQYRKPIFRHGSMRGCLLTEGMNLAKAFKERGMNDGGARGCRLNEKNLLEDQCNEIKCAEGKLNHLLGMKASREACVENGETCGIGHGAGKNVADDDASGNEFNRGQPCTDNYGDNLTHTGCKRKQSTESLCVGIHDNAMNRGMKARQEQGFKDAPCVDTVGEGMKARKEQGFDDAPCVDTVGGQISISDGKSHVILQHIVSTDKQLSDYIQAVKMSIQSVNLLLDNC